MKPVIIFVILISIFSKCAFTQESLDSNALTPLSKDAFDAISTLFKYDHGIPFDVRILERYETRRYFREKIVFTGIRGDRVPGYLAIPKDDKDSHPIVLQFHVGAGSKESWWDVMSFERGLTVTDSLLKLGIAVLALDAQYHGERSVNNDYLPLQQMLFEKKWFYRYRDGIIQTIGDYLRVVEYLSNRKEIDIQNIGVIGHSIGGVMSLIFTALDHRVKVTVASVAAYTDPWLFPITPVNLAKGIQTPTLLLAGRADNVVSIEAMQLLFSALGTEVKEMELYDSGHRLPEENIGRSVGWLVHYLKNR